MSTRHGERVLRGIAVLLCNSTVIPWVRINKDTSCSDLLRAFDLCADEIGLLKALSMFTFRPRKTPPYRTITIAPVKLTPEMGISSGEE